MPLADPDSLMRDLNMDPAAALARMTALLERHHAGLHKLLHMEDSALQLRLDPQNLLEQLAVTAKELQELSGPNMVIISGLSEAGKSTLANMVRAQA